MTGLQDTMCDMQQLVQRTWQPAHRQAEGVHCWVQQDIVTGSLQSACVAAKSSEVGRGNALLVVRQEMVSSLQSVSIAGHELTG